MNNLVKNKKTILNFFLRKISPIKFNKKNSALKQIFIYIKFLSNLILKFTLIKNLFIKNYKFENNFLISYEYDDVLVKSIQLMRFQFLRNAFKRKIKKRYYSFIKKVVKNKLIKKHYKKYNFYKLKKKKFLNLNIFRKIGAKYYTFIKIFFYKQINIFTTFHIKDDSNLVFKKFFFSKCEVSFFIVNNPKKKIFSLVDDLNLSFKRLKFLKKKKWRKKKIKKKLILHFKKKPYVLKKKKITKLLFFYNYKNFLVNSNKTDFLKSNNIFSTFFKRIGVRNNKLTKHEFYSSRKKYVYNNYYPLYNIFDKKVVTSVVLRNVKIPKYNQFYNYYLLNFLEIFLSKHVWIKFNTQCFIPKKVLNFFSSLFFRNKKIQNKLGKHLYLFEFYEILYLSLFYRDVQFLMQWVKKFMEKIHIRFHKRFLKLIYNSLKEKKFLKITNLKGFMMDARGKLGTTGNSKKKHYMFIIGNISYTTKNHDLSVSQDIIRTSTGALGVTIVLSF